ncbi:hypothetical protein [Paraburkholderia xenovorans]|uniref:hypothetical protein n=1 Tax=Paraburkholderia xenovorans TaxID=36873 RepID=UPI0011D0C0F7|nr:hypothetical protein [Paraburkholderia xenovorans]
MVLDLLIANAGIMATLLTRDVRGYEGQFATNHLGHFQLAATLWPSLRRAGGRVPSCFRLAHIAFATSISTTRIIFTGPMTGGKLTDSRKPPMRSWSGPP